MNQNEFYIIKSLADNMSEALTALRSQVAELESNIATINDRLDSTFSKSFIERNETKNRLTEIEKSLEASKPKPNKVVKISTNKKALPVVKIDPPPFRRKKINE